MKLRGIVWVGVQTENFDAMSAFMQALIGVPPPRVDTGFALWSLGNGDLVELYSPGKKPQFGAGPVVGFLVDDLDAGRRQLEALGAEIVGGYGPNEDDYETVQFRAPDGNVYELIRDPMHEDRVTLSV